MFEYTVCESGDLFEFGSTDRHVCAAIVLPEEGNSNDKHQQSSPSAPEPNLTPGGSLSVDTDPEGAVHRRDSESLDELFPGLPEILLPLIAGEQITSAHQVLVPEVDVTIG